MFVHLPRLISDLGANEVVIGLDSGGHGGGFAARPPPDRHGTLDRRGRRPAVIAGSLLNAVVVPLYFTIDSVGAWLVAVRVLHGIASALVFVAITTYGADHVPEARRTQGLALFGASNLIPMAVGGWLGDVILEAGGFDGLFLAATCFAAAGLALALGPARGTPQPGGASRAAPGRLPARPDATPACCRSGSSPSARPSSSRATSPSCAPSWTRPGWARVGIFYAAFAGIAVVLARLLRLGPRPPGPVPGAVRRARGRRRADTVVLAAASSTGRWPAGVLCGAGLGYSFPIMFALVVERAPAEERGSAMAAFTATVDTGALVGSPLLGWVILHFDYR